MLCKNAKKIPPQQQQQQKTMDRADTILLKEDGKSSCSINNRQNSSRATFTCMSTSYFSTIPVGCTRRGSAY